MVLHMTTMLSSADTSATDACTTDTSTTAIPDGPVTGTTSDWEALGHLPPFDLDLLDADDRDALGPDLEDRWPGLRADARLRVLHKARADRDKRHAREEALREREAACNAFVEALMAVTGTTGAAREAAHAELIRARTHWDAIRGRRIPRP